MTILTCRDAPVRSDWVPVGLGTGRTGYQSDWVPVRLGTGLTGYPVRLGTQSDWVSSPDWVTGPTGTQSDWVSFTYKYLIS